MNASFNQGSAKIYQFPVGGRSAIAARFGAQSLPDVKSPSIAGSSSGSWYHEAAIRESEPIKAVKSIKPVIIPLTFPHQ